LVTKYDRSPVKSPKRYDPNCIIRYDEKKVRHTFYRNVWTPFCVDSDINLNPRFWFMYRDVSFDQWMNRYPPTSFYPWQFYGKQYDIIQQWKVDAEHVGNNAAGSSTLPNKR